MKVYLNKNVYEAARERIEYAFKNFDNVLVSFSGGKDSGVCLNLCYDYAKETGQLDKLAFYHLDYEAQYQMTTDYVEDTFKGFEGIKRRYWLCLPILAQCSCRMDGAYWTPWNKSERAIWVREMPKNDFVINEENAPYPIRKNIIDKEGMDDFTRWFQGKYGSTAVIVGIRASESYSRRQLITNTTNDWLPNAQNFGLRLRRDGIELGSICFFYPIYDWGTEDIWIYNARFQKAYNKIYDLYYKAGLTVDKMRVASPFNNSASATLKLYKVIDPKNWGRMVGRVNGVNFAGLYGGTTAMGWKYISLPKGHTWKSYCYFLLSTLPPKLRSHYERILATSIEYWCEKGGFVAEELMPEIEALKSDIEYADKGNAPRFESQKILKFAKYPDDVPVKHFSKFPSYKRMCVCIIKNDYYCIYMGFGRTKEAIEKRKNILEKYKNL